MLMECVLWCNLFHYKDRNIVFVICALIVIFEREFSLSTLTFHFFIYFFMYTLLCTRCCCSPGELLGGGRVTSSTTGVSDVLASVEREERNVRLREFNSGIGASVEGKETSSSLSGKNESRNEGKEETFAQEAERKPGRSAGSSKSKSSLRDVSTLKGLVKGVGFAGSSNASERASFVGFSVFAVLFCLSFLSIMMYIDENCF